MSQKSIVITGANGFVGSHLVETALKQGYKVFAWVREGSDVSFIADLPITIQRVDYLGLRKLLTAFDQIGERVDVFTHCAGVTEGEGDAQFHDGNVVVTQNILKSISNAGLEVGRFVFISSLAARGPADAFYETGADAPITPYGRSKLEAERYVKDNDIPYIIVRATAVYGPRDKAFFELIRLMNRRLQITVGDHDRKLTFVHVQDLCSMVLSVLDQTGCTIYAFDGNTYGPRALFDAIKQGLGIQRVLPIRIGEQSFFAFTRAMNSATRSLTGRAWIYTPEKAKELVAKDWSIDQPLLYQPEYDLSKGLQQTISWYKMNGWL